MKTPILLGIALLSLISCSRAASTFSADYKSTTTAQVSDFVLGFWWGPPPKKQSKQVWQQVKDANFNTCGLSWDFSVADNKKMIRDCNDLGLASWVVDDRVKLEKTQQSNYKDIMKSVVDDYKNEPGLTTYYVMDEPSIPQTIESKKIADIFRKEDKLKLPYTNIFPNYASPAQMGAPTYAQYVERFIQIYKPEVLSFDHYALGNGGERQEYFANLEVMFAAKQKYNLPLWNTVLSYEHLFYRRPSLDDMRWQIYTSLAYGVQGILYFTYYPYLLGGDSKSAIVDAEGKPTELYTIVKNLNKDILTIAPTLAKLKIKNIFHTGPNLPQGTRKLPSDRLKNIPRNAPLIVTEYENNYVMVVNRDLKKSASIDLEGLSAVFELGTAQFEKVSSQKITLNLLPGEGKLLRY